jgi:hypothetical protein
MSWAGAGWFSGPRERREKEKRKKKRWAGWAKKERGKRKAFPFLKRFKHIQFKFKLILNNKQ